jgi:hypothetical protein
LQDLRARFYNSTTGTFTSSDPLGLFVGTPTNHYSYGKDSPTNYADPSGLYSINLTELLGHIAISAIHKTPYSHVASHVTKAAYGFLPKSVRNILEYTKIVSAVKLGVFISLGVNIEKFDVGIEGEFQYAGVYSWQTGAAAFVGDFTALGKFAGDETVEANAGFNLSFLLNTPKVETSTVPSIAIVIPYKAFPDEVKNNIEEWIHASKLEQFPLLGSAVRPDLEFPEDLSFERWAPDMEEWTKNIIAVEKENHQLAKEATDSIIENLGHLGFTLNWEFKNGIKHGISLSIGLQWSANSEDETSVKIGLEWEIVFFANKSEVEHGLISVQLTPGAGGDKASGGGEEGK